MKKAERITAFRPLFFGFYVEGFFKAGFHVPDDETFHYFSRRNFLYHKFAESGPYFRAYRSYEHRIRFASRNLQQFQKPRVYSLADPHVIAYIRRTRAVLPGFFRGRRSGRGCR